MNYEKKYKEALERAKQFSEKPYLEDSKGIVDYIFPELKESEDKKILRSLKAVVKEYDMWPERGLSMNDVLTWLEKQGEQKPAEWSEEDEDMLYKAISVFNKLCAKREEFVWSAETLNKIFWWLKSLKDRVQPQQKQSLDEDTQQWVDAMIKDYEGWLDTDKNHKATIEAKISILKSLRPQKRWKPSDEQIKVCKKVYADILSAKGFDLGTVNGELNRLEEELKKLKE